LISTFHARINGGAVPRSFFAHILFFISVFLQKKRKEKKKKQKLSIFYVSLPTRSNSLLPSSFFSVLLLSRSSLYSLLSRDTVSLNEKVRDREMERRN